MTIAHDASSPARFTLTSTATNGQDTGTSASFTPPANAWVYVSATCNSQASATPTFGNPTNTGGGLGSWTLVKSEVNASGGSVAVWRAFVNSSVATTVTVLITANGNAVQSTNDAAAWVDVWTGAATSQTGAATAGNTSATNNISPTITTTASGSKVAGVAVDWNALGNPTSTDTIDPYTVTGQTSGARVYKAANSGGAGSVAVNFHAATGTPQWTYALYEILAPTGTASAVAEYVTTDVRPDDRAAGVIQRSAAGGALPRIGAFICAAPLFMDLTGSAAHFNAAPGIQGRSICARVTAAPADLPGIAPQVQRAVAAAIATTGAVPNYWDQGLPDRPWDIQGSLSRSVVAGGGAVPNYWDQGIPDRPWDPASSVRPTAVSAPTQPLSAQYTFGTHTAALVTAEAQKSQQWDPATGGALPRIGAVVSGSPAPFDPTVISPQRFRSAAAPALATGSLGAFQSAPEVRNPSVAMPWDPQSPATGGALPRTATYVIAGPGSFDPSVPVAVDPFGSARAPLTGLVPLSQWATPAPLEVIQGWVETPSFSPQGFLVSFLEAAPGDLWPLQALSSPSARAAAVPAAPPLRMQWAAPQALDSIGAVTITARLGPQGPTVRSYIAGPTDQPSVPPARFSAPSSALRFGPVPPFQWSSPAPLDPIQGWIETPTFNPQGALMAYQDGAPGDLWALAPQIVAPSINAPAPPAIPLRMQLAAPQPLDVIAAVAISARIGPQGPTVRAFVAAPADPGPLSSAATFTIQRVGSVPGIGPVPAFIATLASPVEPVPPTPRKFGIAAGGSLPVVTTYQVAYPRTQPELMAPAWSRSVVGPSLALSYQLAVPQPLDSITAQISRAVTAPAIGRVPPYVSAAPQPMDLRLPATIVSSSPGYQGPTVRSFVAAPQRLESALQGIAWSARYSVGPLLFAAVPTVRFVLADYAQRILLSDYPQRIVLTDYPRRIVLT